MSGARIAQVAEMSGAASLPRKNGELTFEAPWQGRSFGIATALYQQGSFDWEDFRQRLIASIEAGEAIAATAPGDAAAAVKSEPANYYEHWLAALESLVLARGFVNSEELARRVAEYRSGGANAMQ